MSVLRAAAAPAQRTERDAAEARARAQLAVFAAELADARSWAVYRPHGGDNGEEVYVGVTYSPEAAIAHLWAGNRLERAA